MKIHRQILASWLLIGLLLAGQFSLLVHQSDHTDLTAASAPCVFCLSHSTFDGAVPAVVIAIPVDEAGTAIVEKRMPAVPDLFLLTANEPRAPPLNS